MVNVLKIKSWLAAAILLSAGLALAACSSPPVPTESGPSADETPVVSTPSIVDGPTDAPPPPTPVPPDPRTLVICSAQEPANLYLYGEGDSRGKRNVLAALYDGPMDINSYRYEPVILEKVPSLADGDALVETVEVGQGETILDASGSLSALEPGVRYRPAGCRGEDCAQEYTDVSGAVRMDRLSVRFRLLPGLKWSDGAPLTAADSVFSFELAADPATPVEKGIFDRTAAYRAEDDLTVLWQGLPGHLDPVYFARFWTPLPAHQWGGMAAQELLESDLANRSPLGYGPYALESWTPGEEIRMAKNGAYFRVDEGLPVFDTLVIRFVEEGGSSAGDLIAAGCDLLDQTIDLEGQEDDLLRLNARGDLRLQFFESRAWEHADFGIMHADYDDGYNFFQGDRPDLFSDVRTRQGIAACMDRQAVVDFVLMGRTEVLHSFVSPTHPLSNPEIVQHPFDVLAGSALLESAGWLDEDGDPGTPRVYRGANLQIPQGTPLAFTYATTAADQRSRTAEILIDSMALCGIGATLETWSIEELVLEGPDGPLFGRRFDMGQFAWENDVFTPFCDFYMTEFIPGGNFERFPYFWGGWNNTGFSDPDYDAACRAALQALPGEPAYAESHLQAQEIFAEQLPVVPLYLHVRMSVTRSDMCGYQPDPTALNDTWQVETLDYGDCAQP